VRRVVAMAGFMSDLHWCDNVVKSMYSGGLAHESTFVT
jgi:hypothetical protein